MSRKSITYMMLTIVLVVYAVAAMVVSSKMSAEELAGEIQIKIIQKADGIPDFVTPSSVRTELHNSGVYDLAGITAQKVDLSAIENSLRKVDHIENATAYLVYNKDHSAVWVEVLPMQPVARIFSPEGSYYINREGKQLSAGPRYKVDVPVVIGRFNEKHTFAEVLPLIDYMKNDLNFAAFISAIEIAPNRDIILYPMHSGPVINFGDASAIKDKLHRIMRMYQDVITVKGYEFYDTISVKFKGQVVATRHKKEAPPPPILFDTETDPEDIDLGYLDTIAVEPKIAQTIQ